MPDPGYVPTWVQLFEITVKVSALRWEMMSRSDLLGERTFHR